MAQAAGRGVTLSPAVAWCDPQLVARAVLLLPGQQAGGGWTLRHASGMALLLRLEECKPSELLLRASQENSTNSYRKSKCPLQTSTRYEAIQGKEKNQMLDDRDCIMLWINLRAHPAGAMPTGPDGSGVLTAYLPLSCLCFFFPLSFPTLHPHALLPFSLFQNKEMNPLGTLHNPFH